MGRPDVSADAIVGFDHHSDEFNLNEREVNADLRRRCPGRVEREVRRILVRLRLRRSGSRSRETVTPSRTSTNRTPPTA